MGITHYYHSFLVDLNKLYSNVPPNTTVIVTE